jgi:hypothetical protein
MAGDSNAMRLNPVRWAAKKVLAYCDYLVYINPKLIYGEKEE